MGDFSSFAKVIIGVGLLLIVIGFFILLLSKLIGWGHLPGDIFYQKGNFTFYFPIVSSIILSLLLTIVLNIILRR